MNLAQWLNEIDDSILGELTGLKHEHAQQIVEFRKSAVDVKMALILSWGSAALCSE